jgi:2-amino-4-hydroxy-6-hydroxymethyldihydropteridine diphosphokinase
MVCALSIGSNQGDRLALLERARRSLSRLPGTRERACAPVYETEPVDVPEPWSAIPFYNSVVVVETTLDAYAFAARALAVEEHLGRVRGGGRHAPRPIDIDLICFDALRLDTPWLRLPHPEAARRRFVCQPLADIDPGWIIPGETRTVAELLAALPARPSVRLADRQWL